LHYKLLVLSINTGEAEEPEGTEASTQLRRGKRQRKAVVPFYKRDVAEMGGKKDYRSRVEQRPYERRTI